MNIRKLLHLAICLLLAVSVSAQTTMTDWGWDWADSSKIAATSMGQYTEFRNNTYPYPAKPRSMWELGISLGKSQIFGDVLNYGFNPGAAITFRHALGHVLSMRFGALYMNSKGIDNKLWTTGTSDGYLSPTLGYRAFTSYGNYANYSPTNSAGSNLRAFVPNYRNATYGGTLDLIASLNSISHYRANPKWDWYVFVGYALVNSDIDTRLALGGTTAFDFTTVNYNGKEDDIQKAVNNLLSQQASGGSKENWTNAPVRRKRDDIGSKGGNFLLNHAMTYGGGFSYKLSPRVNIGIEDRITNPFSGDMDGINTGNNDLLNYASAHLNINLGSRATHVEPLWWLNPNNYVYNELNSPRHLKLPRVLLPDADGDGVTDQFDLEPNTPRGCPVDTHGVSRDTDGDGVPDCRDKEVLTQLKCFPVNSDGVGTCPEPACCKELRDMMANRPAPVANNDCAIGNLPSIQFKGTSTALSASSKSLLDGVASKIKANPNCNIKVIGYGASSKSAQQVSWERVNSVIKYLVERQGIAESRLLFYYGQDGSNSTIDLQGTTESGPTMVPAPHPNLKSRN